jgi:chorismate mutase/prephenate dehydratase
LSDPDENIKAWRVKIDRVDEEILRLLDERARCVAEIGKLKEAGRSSVYVASRELEIFERLEKQHQGPFPRAAIRNVFREIISASRSVEQEVRVAYLGPEATYTHQAGLRSLRRVSAHHQCGDPRSVHHELLSKSGDLRRVRVVCSHPQALAQCRQWLELNLPEVPQFPTPSTALAAERAARSEETAAIASPVAAEIYGLQVIRSGIEDNPSNTTRFLVISQTPPKPSSRDITSILFSIQRDEVGALYKALEPFALHGVNLTRIESRPTKARAWEYVFFCDFEGHVQDPGVAQAIEDLRPRCDLVKVLGSYPRAEAAR